MFFFFHLAPFVSLLFENFTFFLFSSSSFLVELLAEWLVCLLLVLVRFVSSFVLLSLVLSLLVKLKRGEKKEEDSPSKSVSQSVSMYVCECPQASQSVDLSIRYSLFVRPRMECACKQAAAAVIRFRLLAARPTKFNNYLFSALWRWLKSVEENIKGRYTCKVETQVYRVFVGLTPNNCQISKRSIEKRKKI